MGKPHHLSSPSTRNVETLGQVFTPSFIVDRILSLCENLSSGRILEPSCGDGAFLNSLPDTAVGIEKDPAVAHDRARILDFFDLPADSKFDTIVGNPPFVRFRDIAEDTKCLLPSVGFDRRTNLYVFFIWKCLDHLAPGGEIVFINPREFLKATHARLLNERLWKEGTITHLEDLGDARIFKTYSPNCVIWRFQKDRFDRTTDDGRRMMLSNGQLLFGCRAGALLSEIFDIKVGAVSGADSIFAMDGPGAVPFVSSRTRASGELRKMLYPGDEPSPVLLPHKEKLLSRRAARFTEENWWKWVRNIPRGVEGRPRIYVNVKTRHPRPFFMSDCPRWDGSVMALFPRSADIDLQEWVARLNDADWRDLGFHSGGRLIFGQKSLANAPVV